MANQVTTNLPATINKPKVVARLKEAFKANTPAVISSMLTIWRGNQLLQKCSDTSILSSLMMAGTLNLSISPAMGQAYIVPYKKWDKDTRTENYEAQFQIGWRGYVQLALRTGKYAALHAGKICDGELRGFNPITGEPILGEKLSDEVVGYVAYMRLTNGFEKTLYMTIEEMQAHAEKYSQSYSYDKKYGKKTSPWTTSFDAMASKTVLKRLLSNFGVLSAELVNAIQSDQAVIDRDNFTYVDNGGHVQPREEIYIPSETPALEDPAPEIVNIETGEVQEETFVEVGGESKIQTPF